MGLPHTLPVRAPCRYHPRAARVIVAYFLQRLLERGQMNGFVVREKVPGGCIFQL